MEEESKFDIESIVRNNKAKILNEKENDNQYFYTYSRKVKLYFFKDNIFFFAF
jgi:hypothetical protein